MIEKDVVEFQLDFENGYYFLTITPYERNSPQTRYCGEQIKLRFLMESFEDIQKQIEKLDEKIEHYLEEYEEMMDKVVGKLEEKLGPLEEVDPKEES